MQQISIFENTQKDVSLPISKKGYLNYFFMDGSYNIKNFIKAKA
jgi:hypothetical protein